MSKKKKREHQIKLITRLLIAIGTFLAGLASFINALR